MEKYKLEFEEYRAAKKKELNDEKQNWENTKKKFNEQLETKQRELAEFANEVKRKHDVLMKEVAVAQAELNQKQAEFDRQQQDSKSKTAKGDREVGLRMQALDSREKMLQLNRDEFKLKERELQMQSERMKGQLQLFEDRKNALVSKEQAVEMQIRLADEKMKMVLEKEKGVLAQAEKTNQTQSTFQEEEEKLKEMAASITEREEKLRACEQESLSAHAEAVKLKEEWEQRTNTQKEMQDQLDQRLADIEAMETALAEREKGLSSKEQATMEINSKMSQREQTVQHNVNAVIKKEADMNARWELLDPIKAMLTEREKRLEDMACALQCRELETAEQIARVEQREALAEEREHFLAVEQQNLELAARTLAAKGSALTQQQQELQSRELALDKRQEDIDNNLLTLKQTEEQMVPKMHDLELRERKVALREEKSVRLSEEVERREKEMEKRRKELTIILDREKDVDRRKTGWPEKRAGASYLEQSMLADMKVKRPKALKHNSNSPYPYNAKSGLSILQPSQHALEIQKRRELIEDMDSKVTRLARKFDCIVKGVDEKTAGASGSPMMMMGGPSAPSDAKVDPVALSKKYDEVQCAEIEHVIMREAELKSELGFLKKLKAGCPFGGKSRWNLDGRAEVIRLETIEKWWKEQVSTAIDKRLTEMLKERKEMLETCLKLLNVAEFDIPTKPKTASTAVASNRELHKLAQHRELLNGINSQQQQQQWATTTNPTLADGSKPVGNPHNIPARPSTAGPALGGPLRQ
eukprot:TRINITY_DN61125_c0_g1_i1.p1 TRINITY_DN61125_c0_g1~~TRINITY_DN61125_c0_g1_i1.p1  ORF type:complete len:859 (+),score=143.20 TRINITY_DN61125_c0_g1_i1:305-2578(+)